MSKIYVPKRFYVPKFKESSSHDEIVKNVYEGELVDEITYLDTGKKEIIQRGHNSILPGIHLLIAALLKRETGYDAKGILYWENGSGVTTWDTTPYVVAGTELPADWINLNSFRYRKAISASDITFIDADDVESATITNRLKVVTTFLSSECNGTGGATQYLRDISLWGGKDASDTVSTGLMLNMKVHDSTPKNSSTEIKRTLRFTFRSTTS